MTFQELIDHHKRIFAPLTPYEGVRQSFLAAACLVQLMAEGTGPYSAEEVEQLEQRFVLLFVAVLSNTIANEVTEIYGIDFDKYDEEEFPVSPYSVGSGFSCLVNLILPEFDNPKDLLGAASFLGLSKDSLIQRYLEFSQGMRPPTTPTQTGPSHRAYDDPARGWD